MLHIQYLLFVLLMCFRGVVEILPTCFQRLVCRYLGSQTGGITGTIPESLTSLANLVILYVGSVCLIDVLSRFRSAFVAVR